MTEIVEIPFQQLKEDVLDAIIESFVLREGTDYGEYEYSLADKKSQLLRQICRGEVVIIYEEATETCNLLHKESLC
jgi:uncharacterized protein YheU (UPF0270 family)